MNPFKYRLTNCTFFLYFILLSVNSSHSGNLGMVELAEIYANDNLTDRAEQLVNLYKSVNEYEAFLVLPHLAKTYIKIGNYDASKKYADIILKIADKYKDSWSYGNAIHDANMVLGLIAVHEQDIQKAKNYLLKAGDTPGSYQITNVGPNMMLAKELSEKGENDTVLFYLKKIEKLWLNQNDDLKSWISQIEKGKIPRFENSLDL